MVGIKLIIRKPEVGKNKNLTRQQKVDRLLQMEFKNHREFLKELVVIEYESSFATKPFNNEEEMNEFIARKRQRLLEIEMENKKKMETSPVALNLEPTATRKKKAATQMEEGTRRSQPTITATMPRQLLTAINELGGDDVMWIIEKKLTSTDMRTGHNRLSIPERQVSSEKFLTDAERRQASNDGIAVDVLVLGKGAQQPVLWCLLFKKWLMNKTSIYVLIRRWAKLVKEEGLKEGHTVQIWSFRGSQNGGEKKLYFAINVVYGMMIFPQNNNHINCCIR